MLCSVIGVEWLRRVDCLVVVEKVAFGIRETLSLAKLVEALLVGRCRHSRLLSSGAFENQFGQARLAARGGKSGPVERVVGKHVVDSDSEAVVARLGGVGSDKRRESGAESEATAAEVVADGEIPEPERVGIGSVDVERDGGENLVIEFGLAEVFGERRKGVDAGRVVVGGWLATNDGDAGLPVTNFPA